MKRTCTAAKDAGLSAIWRRDHFWDEPERADWVIDDLAELDAWLDRQG